MPRPRLSPVFSLQRPLALSPVWGPAALVVALAVAGVVYDAHQTGILRVVGWGGGMADLTLIQGGLGVVIEPAAGYWADAQRGRGQAPIQPIAVGLATAGLLFTLLAQILQVPPSPALGPVIVGLMLLWAAAIQSVQGPAVAWLAQGISHGQRPAVGQGLALVLALVGAARPWVFQSIQQLGPHLALVLGAGVLLASLGAVYGWRPLSRGGSACPLPVALSRLRALQLLGLGACTGLLLGLVWRTAPSQGSSRGALWISALMLVAALATLPAGRLLQVWGAGRGLQLGWIGLFTSWVLTWLIPSDSWSLVLGGGLAVGLTLTSLLPYGLAVVPRGAAGRAGGLVLGGVSAAQLTLNLVCPGGAVPSLAAGLLAGCLALGGGLGIVQRLGRGAR